MIDKWLKADIFEQGNTIYPKEGTPQGGSISPLLSNIYIHHVPDEWFIEQIQPLLKGQSIIIRFADDFLSGFTNNEDVKRVMELLPKRLGKYGLTLHPEQARLIDLNETEGDKAGTFDFLEFTHYMGISRKGRIILKRKTSSKKLRASLKRMNEWIRDNRHLKFGKIISQMNQKLRAQYGYYGITFNSKLIECKFERSKRLLRYWLYRSGGKRAWNWERYCKSSECDTV